MQEINVDKIMEEIREEIREKGMEEQKLTFADVNPVSDFLELPNRYDKDMMHRELVNLNGVWDTSMEELQSNHPVKRAVKKTIQRAVRMVVGSHVAKQVAFNASVVDSINMLHCLAEENEALREEVKMLREQTGQLQEQMERMKGQTEQLQEQLSRMQGQTEQLREQTSRMQGQSEQLKERNG